MLHFKKEKKHYTIKYNKHNTIKFYGPAKNIMAGICS